MKKRKFNRVFFTVIAIALAVGCLIGGCIGYFIGKSQTEIIEVEVIKYLPDVRPENTENIEETENTEELPVKEEQEPELVSLGIYKATAYCSCKKCCGEWAAKRPLDDSGNPIVYTSTGAVAEQGKTIAVDPSVIPYGTEVIIDGHTYIAEDCGGSIKGNRIDIYFECHQEALQYGVKEVELFVAS